MRPRIDQVRRTGGISEMPDSSKKTIQADSARPPYLCGDPRSTGSVDWLSGTFPGGGVAAPNRSRGQGGTPPATRGRTTLAPATGRRMLARPGKVVQRSAQAVHLLTVVVVGVCVRVPSLIWVRGPTRVRRQDDRWGIPGVRGRAVCWGRPRTSRGGRGLAGAGRGTSVCRWGRARTSHLGQAAWATGRSSTGASAVSPRLTRVWRTRRASLRATARVARLPPWRALTWV